MRAKYISVSCCDVKRPSANAAAISMSDISAGGSAEAAGACAYTAPAAAAPKKSRLFIDKHPRVRCGAYSNPYFLRGTGIANLTQHDASIQGYIYRMTRSHIQCKHLHSVRPVTPSGEGCVECLAS